MNRRKISRRRFIQTSALTTCSLLFLNNCSIKLENSQWKFFTTEEVSLVDALVEQIIPTDEWLGAKDAHVTNFIDKQLTGPYKELQEKYTRGLKLIKVSCDKLFNDKFENLEWDIQTEFLIDMELGKLSKLDTSKLNGNNNQIWKDGFGREFFNIIREHTMQGYYGSPRHGGNYRYVSYKMLGLDFLPIIGQNRY